MIFSIGNIREHRKDFREAQYTAMRAAIAAGMSAYRVAQLTGMTQRAVHRIRDREIGAAATRE